MYTRKEVYTRKEPVQPILQSAVHSFVQPLVQPPVFKVIIFILKGLSSVDVIASDSHFSKPNLHCMSFHQLFYFGSLADFCLRKGRINTIQDYPTKDETVKTT